MDKPLPSKLNEQATNEQFEKERKVAFEKVEHTEHKRETAKRKWLLRSQKLAKNLRWTALGLSTEKGAVSRERRRSAGEISNEDRATPKRDKKLFRMHTVDESKFKKKLEKYTPSNEGEFQASPRGAVCADASPGSPDGHRRTGICEEMEKEMICQGDSLHSLREAIIVQETLRNNFLL